jgi:hypothetical protein
MTDAELCAEADSISRAEDTEALANPVRLARHLDPKYRMRPHLALIGSAMGELRRSSGDCLMIFTPPQVGKTVSAAVWGPFWWLALYPEDHVIIGSYGNILAINRGRQVRKLVNEYGHRYNISLERGSQAANDWHLASGGGVKSVGVGAGIAGVVGDIVIIDDPHKSRAEADSWRLRDKVWQWMSADINSRRQPGSPTVLIQTRWHEDDLGGRLIKEQGTVEEGGRWRVLHMPAIAGANDVLGREPGEPLPHPKIPTRDKVALLAHWDEKRRSSINRDWFALYQGDPQPAEGALVTEDMMRKRSIPATEAAPAVITVVAVDPSGGGRDECGIGAGYRGTDGRIYFTHDLSAVMPSTQWPRVVCELALLTGAEVIVFEHNYGGDQAQVLIRTAWAALAAERQMPDMPPRIESVHAKKNKRLRAEPVAQLIIEDRYRFVGYHPNVVRQWTTWQPTDTESPGALDVSVYLGWRLIGDGPAEVATMETSAETPALPTVPSMPSASRPGTLPTVPGSPSGGFRRMPGTPGLPGRPR